MRCRNCHTIRQSSQFFAPDADIRRRLDPQADSLSGRLQNLDDNSVRDPNALANLTG
jgi:hypothetical protein